MGSASALRTAAWQELPNEFKDSIFLLSLVLAASMMLVLAASMMLAHTLPDASERVAMRLGFRLRRVR